MYFCRWLIFILAISSKFTHTFCFIVGPMFIIRINSIIRMRLTRIVSCGSSGSRGFYRSHVLTMRGLWGIEILRTLNSSKSMILTTDLCWAMHRLIFWFINMILYQVEPSLSWFRLARLRLRNIMIIHIDFLLWKIGIANGCVYHVS